MTLTIRHTRLFDLLYRLERIKKQFKENEGDFDFKVVKSYFKDAKHGTDFNSSKGYTWNTYRVLVDEVEITGNLENKSWKVVGIAERQHNGEVTVFIPLTKKKPFLLSSMGFRLDVTTATLIEEEMKE